MLYQIQEETKHELKQFHILVHEDRFQVHLTAMQCGKDWNVLLIGGEKHHVGAIALGVPGYIDEDRSRPTVSVSSLCVTGHKDDELARMAAEELVKNLAARVVVVVGIHLDKATPKEISSICNAAMTCCKKLEEQIDLTKVGA